MLTSNFVYRWHLCALSIEEVMEITGRSRTTVLEWDRGRNIPFMAKRLMAFASGLTPPSWHSDWENHQFRGKWLKMPNGQMVTARELEWAIHLLTQAKKSGMY